MAEESDTTPPLGVKAVPTLLRRIGDYEVTGVLGRGGFGVVYAAERRGEDRRYAIKVLAAELAGDDEMIRRFSRETSVVNRISHPSIIHPLEVGRLPDGRPYFVMSRVEGLGLHQVIHTLGALAIGDVIMILEPVCDALAAAHAAGVVHRDLKAANLIVAAQGEGAWRVWLTDFGIAKLIDVGGSTLTIAGQRLGTPEYMAPEQVLGGEIDARTDVYALGVLAFHMLTGRFPFRHADPEEVEHMQVSAVPELHGLAPELAAVIARSLEKLPRRRYPTALAFHAALRDGAVGITSQPAPRNIAAIEVTPTRSIASRERGEVAVAVVIAPAGRLPAIDADELARSTGGTALEVRPVDAVTMVCLIRGRPAGDLGDDLARVAQALRRAAPDAAIVVRLAPRGATDLHVAFNAAMAAARGPLAAGVIAIDTEIAGRLADRHPIDWRGGRAYLGEESS